VEVYGHGALTRCGFLQREDTLCIFGFFKVLDMLNIFGLLGMLESFEQ
jgi:hypothetical protein